MKHQAVRFIILIILADHNVFSYAETKTRFCSSLASNSLGMSKSLASIPRCGSIVPNKILRNPSIKVKTDASKQISSERNGKSLFPIFKNELPQFICMSMMMFLFIYVYTTARDTKDSLVVSNCGAESIPFLKMYGVMPSALLFIMVYSKFSQILGKQTLFYATLLPVSLQFMSLLIIYQTSIHSIGSLGT